MRYVKRADKGTSFYDLFKCGVVNYIGLGTPHGCILALRLSPKMKQKDARRCRHAARKRGSKSAAKTKVTEVEEPVLAIGEEVLFGDYWIKKALGTGNNEDDSAEEKSIIQAAYLKAHIPVCPETKLVQKFISSLGKLHMQAAWCLLAPSYIGYSKEIDLAAQAVITAIESQHQKSVIVAHSAYNRYGEAITALRKTIE